MAAEADARRRDSWCAIDDIVVGFEFKSDAETFWKELQQRMEEVPTGACTRTRHGLSSSDAMRRPTEKACRSGQAGDFDFLGFTHLCGRRAEDGFTVLRQTIRKPAASQGCKR